MSASRTSKRPVAFALVDPETWSRAGWNAMTYAVDQGVPVMAMVFRDGALAARLAAFKTTFASAGRYRVAPATFGGTRIDVMWDHALTKRRLALRRICDVGAVGDPDAGLWQR